jgi:hypothetical protein
MCPPTAAAKRLKCARSPLLPPHLRCFEERENELVACADDCRLRWLPTRILRDCRFAPTAELDLHLYAIGCDIVIARQKLRACVFHVTLCACLQPRTAATAALFCLGHCR